MDQSYADFAYLFKSLSDETRLKIIGMLSCGELCACEILKSFKITQPTLSYHMKILTDCGIVIGNRKGAWMHYSLNSQIITQITEYWGKLTSCKDNCISHDCRQSDCLVQSDKQLREELLWHLK